VLENLIGLAVLIFSGAFGTQQVQRFRDRKNGNDPATRIVLAIREEGQRTRESLDNHIKVSTEANASFHSTLAKMRQDCGMSHAMLLERVPRR